MRTPFAVALAALVLGACASPCQDSANVLLLFDGDAAVFSAATQLELVLTIDGVPASKQPAAITGAFSSGTTVLLVPSTNPTAATYTLGVMATLSGNSGTLATGTTTLTASTHACNRATIALAAVTAPVDARMSDSPSGDLARTVPDAAMPDLTCVPSSLDEDSDGISDPCDVCAANPDAVPTDTDHDGVPDKCDPDPAVADNAVLLFEPFNVALGTAWTGTKVEANSMLVMAENDCDAVSQEVAGIGATFQLQTYVTPTSIDIVSAPDYALVGVYAMATSSTGVGCSLRADSMGNYDLVLSEGDVLGDPNFGGGGAVSAATVDASDIMAGDVRRLRVSVHGDDVYCELATIGGAVENTLSSTLTVASTNFLPTLHTCFAAAKFSSVFATSYP